MIFHEQDIVENLRVEDGVVSHCMPLTTVHYTVRHWLYEHKPQKKER